MDGIQSWKYTHAHMLHDLAFALISAPGAEIAEIRLHPSSTALESLGKYLAI
jgi:hypothetical protein